MKEKKSCRRKIQIDILRIIACFFVVFYHYYFYGPIQGILTNESFYKIFSFGFIGVDLFFVISGYVILASLNNYSLISFLKARIKRIYSTYWICLTITSCFLLLSHERLSLLNYISNLTLLQTFMHQKNIDGVYWTLIIELIFYVLISFVFYVFKSHFIKLLYLWLLLAYLSFFELFEISFIRGGLILNWIPYFMLGLIFYYWYEKGEGKYIFILGVFSFILVALRTYERSLNLNVEFDLFVDPIKVVMFLSFILFFVFYILRFDLEFKMIRKYLISLSLATYPIYLLHQEIGYILIRDFNIPIFLVVFVIIFISLYIVPKIEFIFKKILANLKNEKDYFYK